MRFFHARASQRLHRNTICILKSGGVHIASHDAKVVALHAFYLGLLGRAVDTEWLFDLDALFAGYPRVDAGVLVAPFLPGEVRAAEEGVNRESAPGPDGLGPSLYWATWPTIELAALCLFDPFFLGQSDLGCTNRAHVVLLPKKAGVLSPSSFRPVSLQNCSIKMVCRTLTSCLQCQIGRIIDADQSGFLAGRTILENFVYAMELIQTCYLRCAPCQLVKLDFTKAFDSINWDNLRLIMLACHFPPLWCDWMDAIFSSLKSSILLNGVPGPWIDCKRGLRQGEPLSPTSSFSMEKCSKP
jgi:hypothetical protein